MINISGLNPFTCVVLWYIAYDSSDHFVTAITVPLASVLVANLYTGEIYTHWLICA